MGLNWDLLGVLIVLLSMMIGGTGKILSYI